MEHTRRRFVKASGLALTAGLAGCTGGSGGDDGTSTESPSEPSESTATGTDNDGSDAEVSAQANANVAVAAEFNVLRSRVSDAVALGTAGEFEAGASVAHDVLERFEADEAEWGSHERMEKASHDAYETFEGALERIEGGLKEENLLKARSAGQEATGAVRTAMEATVEANVVDAFDAQWFGARAANSGSLAAAGHVEAAATVAGKTLEAFEDAPAHGAMEDAAHDAYESFEDGLKAIRDGGKGGDAKTYMTKAKSATTATLDASYALASETEAGAGALATMQAGAWDAYAMTRTDAAAEADLSVLAEGVFTRFENARVHGTLEKASHEAYEQFESTLKAYQQALSSGKDIEGKLDAFVAAAVRAEFTVVGAAGKAP